METCEAKEARGEGTRQLGHTVSMIMMREREKYEGKNTNCPVYVCVAAEDDWLDIGKSGYA